MMLNIADAKVQSRILQGGYLYNYRYNVVSYHLYTSIAYFLGHYHRTVLAIPKHHYHLIRHCNIIIPDKNEYEMMLNIADAKVQSRILQGGYLLRD
jgi:hypothetical protein